MKHPSVQGPACSPHALYCGSQLVHGLDMDGDMAAWPVCSHQQFLICQYQPILRLPVEDHHLCVIFGAANIACKWCVLSVNHTKLLVQVVLNFY